MGMAELVVTAVVFEGRSRSEVARVYDLSRRWVITIVQRYLAEGEAALQPRSRRPLRSPNRTPVTVEDEIVAPRGSAAPRRRRPSPQGTPRPGARQGSPRSDHHDRRRAPQRFRAGSHPRLPTA